jgi:hypothetical protein
VCKILYGTKEPLDDDSETHGLCQECFDVEIRKIGDFLSSQEKIEDPGER